MSIPVVLDADVYRQALLMGPTETYVGSIHGRTGPDGAFGGSIRVGADQVPEVVMSTAGAQPMSLRDRLVMEDLEIARAAAKEEQEARRAVREKELRERTAREHKAAAAKAVARKREEEGKKRRAAAVAKEVGEEKTTMDTQEEEEGNA
jgi:hypothetical protein